MVSDTGTQLWVTSSFSKHRIKIRHIVHTYVFKKKKSPTNMSAKQCKGHTKNGKRCNKKTHDELMYCAIHRGQAKNVEEKHIETKSTPHQPDVENVPDNIICKAPRSQYEGKKTTPKVPISGQNRTPGKDPQDEPYWSGPRQQPAKTPDVPVSGQSRTSGVRGRKCQFHKTIGNAGPCSDSDKERNFKGRCVKKCNKSQYRDPETDRCKKWKDPEPCSDPEKVTNSKGRCVKKCDEKSQERNSKGRCVKKCDEKSQERNSKGRCVKKCTDSQYRDRVTNRCKSWSSYYRSIGQIIPCSDSDKERNFKGRCVKKCTNSQYRDLETDRCKKWKDPGSCSDPSKEKNSKCRCVEKV